MFTVSINDDELTPALERVLAALTDPLPLMQDLGELMVDSTKQNFAEGSDPEGKPWKPKSEATLEAYRRRGDGRPTRPLIGPSKTLSTTINYEASADKVYWGSNVIQAAVMQLGAAKGAFGTASNGSSIPWGAIPARPYIGAGDEDLSNILATIEDYLAGAAAP